MKLAKYALVALLLLVPVFGWMAIAHAQSFRSGSSVTVPANNVVNSTLYAAARTVDIAGVVNGDVICAGRNVTISAVVNGDVICAGQSVSVTGRVRGDVHLLGQNVTLGGTVDGDVNIAANTFTEESRGSVGRDMGIAVRDASINGPVGRDLAASVGTLTINNLVGRDVQASVQTLTLGDAAKVGGSIQYASNKTLTRSSGAQVAGTITRTTPQAHAAHSVSWALFGLVAAAYVLITLLLVALVLALIMPRVFQIATRTARLGTGKTFLIGLVASIVVPIVLLVLLFTVIGTPLALFGGLVWLLLVLLSGPFAAYWLGRLILRDRDVHAVWIMLLGGAILLLLSFIPVIDVITSLLSLWFGLGAILRYLIHVRRGQLYRLIPDETLTS